MRRFYLLFRLTSLILVLLAFGGGAIASAVTSDSGSVGIEGVVNAPPPKQGATISIPSNGQSFTTLPITVSGICPTGLLVKLFKNNVFGGSVQCENGSYSIKTDLFTDKNELLVRVYDALDQAGPDSNIVTVTFNNSQSGTSNHPTLTSDYAKRGANPNETLSWPIILSGGEGPYAISVDWGDGKAPDLISQPFPGTFTINHKYAAPGVFNIIVKATDKNGLSAFLQLVGIANGALSQDNKTTASPTGGVTVVTKIIWWPAAVLIVFIAIAFWLGKRHELFALRRRLERSESNNRFGG